MNHELRQRLIGAVVVTALAAIFIPMLFDDPIDNSGQKVSELVIPATPVNTGEESANKLPTGVNQVLNKPDAGTETVVNIEEEAELASDKQHSSEETLPNETETLAEEGIDQAVDDSEQAIDEPEDDRSSTSLDTGVVDKTNKPATTKESLKKIEPGLNKQTAKAKPMAAATVNKIEKPVDKPAKSSPELKRWTIQAGSFSKKENAISRMEAIRKLGLPVTMESSKGLYRLIVGPSLEKKRAADMKAKLDSQKIQSIMIAE
ncbi:MAG: SPOR domain-containing protein [Methylococcaceae bacterium]